MKTIYYLLMVCMLGSLQVFSQSITSANKYYYQPKDTVRIKGSGFSTSSSSVFIRLNNTYLKPVSLTSTTITFIAPARIYSGRVTYLDSAGKKFASSRFDIHISTQFKGATSIDATSFKKVEYLYMDTMPHPYKKTYFADFNNDGINEMLLLTRESKVLTFRKKDGEYIQADSFSTDNGTIFSIQDYNNDGKLDIMTYEYPDRTVLWKNTSSGTSISFTKVKQQDFVSSISRINPSRFVDFNGDGRPDLISGIHYLKTDSFLYLNKPDNAGLPDFRLTASDTNLMQMNNIRPIDLDGDSLTDFIAMPYSGNSYMYLFRNVSKGDTMHFKLVDSIGNADYLDEYGEMDFNGDHRNDIFLSLYDYTTSRYVPRILVNTSTGSTLSFKHIATNLQFNNTYFPYFWDYDLDSVPDMFYTIRDSVFCNTLSIRNDSLLYTNSFIYTDRDRQLTAIEDINDNNQPDLVCINLYSKRVDFLLGDAFSLHIHQPLINFIADSVNHVFRDSLIFTYQSGKPFQIDTLTSRAPAIKFFSSRSYSAPIKYPVKLQKDSTYTLYFAYTYKTDRRDSVFVNQSSFLQLGIIKSKKAIPCAVINSIDKTVLRPGDTITIRGRHFFENINHISVRINNRRCKVLSSSKDTLLRIIYPAMTSAAKLLITDTFKHYNVYSRQTIYPSFRKDTGTIFNKNSFISNFYGYRDFVRTPYPDYQKYFELPANLTTGNLLNPDDCIMDKRDDSVVALGKMDLQPYVYKNDYSRCRFRFNEDLRSYLYYKLQYNDNQFHLMDVNADGMLDYCNLADSSAVYFCNMISDTMVQYGSETKIPVMSNPGGLDMLRLSFTDPMDFDMDGNIDFMSPSLYEDSLYFFYYDRDARKLAYQNFLLVEPGSYLYSVSDYTNDGKPDLLFIRINNSQTAYQYYIRENVSNKGTFRFSDKKMMLVDSTYSTNMFFHQLDLNSDQMRDLVLYDNYGNYKIYLADSVKGSIYHKLDSFSMQQDQFYKYGDIDGDGRPEMFGIQNGVQYAYRYKIENSKFNIYKLNIPDFDFMKASIEDANGDNLPDFVVTSAVLLNTLSSATFGDRSLLIMESADFQATVTDSLVIHNNGSRNIHLKNITSSDTHFYFHTRTKLSLSYPVALKPKDSLVFYITFKPSSADPQKSYKTVVEAHFAEDMPVTCKQVWGYVNLAPTITKVLPHILIPGDTAAIIGRNFDNVGSSPVVNFADARAEIIGYDDTLILVKIPNGSMDGVVTVFDTSADMIGFSPLPLHYSFLGTSGPITENSFKRSLTSAFPYNCYVNDFNADGLPDILYDSGSINSRGSFVLFNQSDFSGLNFNRKEVYDGYSFTNTYLRKDLDGDGILDGILVFNVNSGLNLFSAYFNGSRNGNLFENSSLIPVECIPTDLNKNGKLELNFGNYGAQSSFYEYNVKSDRYNPCNDYKYIYNESFLSPKPIGHAVYDFDFDGDGIGELLFEDTSINVAFNKTRNDTFDYTGILRLSTSPRNGYNVADMNNDGKLDIITVTQPSGTGVQQLCIYRNTSTKGNLSFSKYMDTMPRLYYWNDYFHLRDLNGDQKPEIIVFNSGLTDTFIIITNETSGNNFSFDKYCKIRTIGEVHTVTEADMNADTKVDMVIQTDSGIFIYRNISISGFLSRNSYTFTQQYGFPLSLSMAIYNDGGDTLIIDKIRIPAGYKLVNSNSKFNISGSMDYSLNGEVTLPIKINVADSFQFYIVKDENALPGKYKDTFLFYNNQGSAPYRFVMQGEVKPAPLAKTRIEAIDFGTLKYKRTRSDSFYLRNIGYDTLKLVNIFSSDTSHFKIAYDKSRKYVLAGDSIKFKATFHALNRGTFNADLTIAHNDYTRQTVINLEGKCIAPEIRDSLVVDFNNRYAYTTAQGTVLLKNTGDDTLLITNIAHVTNKPFVSSADKNANDKLLPGDSVKFTVSFSPDSIRTYRNQIVISHNAPNASSRIILKGAGVAAHFANNKQVIDLGWLKINKTYQFTHTVGNDGNRKLKIGNMKHSVSGFQSTICPGNPDSIDVNKTGSICLSVLRNQAGIINDTLNIQHSGLDTLAKWYFKARFIRPLPSANITRSAFTANIYRKDTASLTVYNNGDDTLFNLSHTLSNPSRFSIIDPSGFNGQVLPGQSRKFRLEFIPSDTLVAQSKLSIGFSNDTTKFIFNLNGKGFKGIPLITKQPLSMTAELNKSIKVSRSIRNAGNQSLKITGVQHSNTAFSSQLSKNTILVKDSAILEITFSPASYVKWQYDTAVITSVSDSIRYRDTIFIAGKCLYPELQLSRTGTIQFPPTKTQTSALDSIVISNTGDDTLNIQLSALTAFVHVQGQGPFIIAPQNKMSAIIQFTPAARKNYLDSFKLSGNAATGVTTFLVKGTGIFNRDNYKLGISKARIDFGQVKVGLTASDSFELSNTGTDTVHLHWNVISPPFANLQGTSLQILPGQKRSVVINFQPLNNLAYLDTIRISNEFMDSIGVVTLTGNGFTSVRSLQLSDAIKVYPNPANDRLEIRHTGPQSASMQFQLFDVTGKELFPAFTRLGTSIHIDTHTLSNGVYLLSVASDGVHYQTRVVIQH